MTEGLSRGAESVRLSVLVDGAEPFEPSSLTGVTVSQEVNLCAQCEILVEPSRALGPEVGRPGSRLELRVGARLLFRGAFVAREWVHAAASAPRLRLRAYDGLWATRCAHTVRPQVQSSVASLLDELLAPHGLRVRADEPGPVAVHRMAPSMGDLDWCGWVAEQVGLYFFLGEDGVELFRLSRPQPSVTLADPRAVLLAELEEMPELSRGAVVLGWHPRDVATFEARTERRAPRAAVGAVGSQGASKVAHEPRLVFAHPSDTQAHTDAAALAHAERQAARAQALRAVLLGDAALRPGLRFHLPELPGASPNGYLLTRVVHRMSPESGYVTEISNQPPAMRAGPDSGTRVELAIVTAVDAATFRVKVRCPMRQDQETDWLQVVAPGAGPQTGLFILPRVGDNIIVLVDADASRCVVVGGVVGAAGPALDGEEGVLPTQLRCREGHRVELAPSAVRVVHAGGAVVELREKELALRHPDGSHVVVDGNGITLSAVGKTLTLVANRVDFVRK